MIQTLIEYSSNMQCAYKNIEEYNLGRKCNIVFPDMVADMTSDKTTKSNSN